VARARQVFASVVLVGLLAGCNVHTRFDITVHDDGSGTIRTTITLDDDAVQRMGGAASLAKTVPLADLRTAGWTVSSWKGGDGGTQIPLAGIGEAGRTGQPIEHVLQRRRSASGGKGIRLHRVGSSLAGGGPDGTAVARG